MFEYRWKAKHPGEGRRNMFLAFEEVWKTQQKSLETRRKEERVKTSEEKAKRLDSETFLERWRIGWKPSTVNWGEFQRALKFGRHWRALVKQRKQYHLREQEDIWNSDVALERRQQVRDTNVVKRYVFPSPTQDRFQMVPSSTQLVEGTSSFEANDRILADEGELTEEGKNSQRRSTGQSVGKPTAKELLRRATSNVRIGEEYQNGSIVERRVIPRSRSSASGYTDPHGFGPYLDSPEVLPQETNGLGLKQIQEQPLDSSNSSGAERHPTPPITQSAPEFTGSQSDANSPNEWTADETTEDLSSAQPDATNGAEPVSKAQHEADEKRRWAQRHKTLMESAGPDTSWSRERLKGWIGEKQKVYPNQWKNTSDQVKNQLERFDSETPRIRCANEVYRRDFSRRKYVVPAPDPKESPDERRKRQAGVADEAKARAKCRCEISMKGCHTCRDNVKHTRDDCKRCPCRFPKGHWTKSKKRAILSKEQAEIFDARIRDTFKKRNGDNAKWYFEMIGESYIHSMMDGEAMKYQNDKGIPASVFEIR